METPSPLLLNFAPVGNSENLVWITPHVRRIVANNPSPFTFTGTNTYIIGVGNCTIIDPGPNLDTHYEAILSAVFGETVKQILITHRHKDHCGLAQKLAAVLNCPIAAMPYVPHPIHENINLESSFDSELVPDILLHDGQILSSLMPLRVIHTPGHTPDHACFALESEGILFSGDHVMGWSTTVIAPPLGHMGNYFAALEKLLTRNETLYFSGHGSEIPNPHEFVQSLLAHRKAREAKIIELLKTGEFTLNSPPLPALRSTASEGWAGGGDCVKKAPTSSGISCFRGKNDSRDRLLMPLNLPQGEKGLVYDLNALTRAIYGEIAPNLFFAARATTQAHVEWIMGQK